MIRFHKEGYKIIVVSLLLSIAGDFTCREIY